MIDIDHRIASDLATLLREVARAEILPRFRRLGADAVRSKSGPLDLVTDADEAAERVITAALHARFPGCLVVGEEAAAADPALMDGLDAAQLAFTVDPVDGTQNFAAGLPLFGCMVAALRAGEVVAAWIHDPLGDDTAIALRGEGAWIEALDGTRRDLHVAASVPPVRMVAALSWGWLPEPERSRVVSRLPLLGQVVGFRCAAHEYRAVAGGGLHALLYGRTLPWDHAPGWLLHREAGGFSARVDGRAYRAAERTGALLMAPDAASWATLRDALFA